MTKRNNQNNNTNNNNKQKMNNKSNPISYNITKASRTRNSTVSNNKSVEGTDIFVQSYTGALTFTSNSSGLNPRLGTTFPSASLVAARYDAYLFEELEFIFHPTTAVTTTPGMMFLAWEPNAARGPPTNVAQLTAYEYQNSGAIYQRLSLKIPKSALGPRRYCRNGPISYDPNMYDTGRLVYASQDVPEGQGGYIEVRYKVRFYFYHLDTNLPGTNRTARISMSADYPVQGSSAEQLPLDTVSSGSFGGSGALTVVGGKVTLPVGSYLAFTRVRSAWPVTNPIPEDPDQFINLNQIIELKIGGSTPTDGRSYNSAMTYTNLNGSFFMQHDLVTRLVIVTPTSQYLELFHTATLSGYYLEDPCMVDAAITLYLVT